jgi:anti-sigma B factor antagonist
MRDLTIHQREVRGVVIVDLEGTVALGETGRSLHDAIELIKAGNKQEVLLNLAGVTKIDSSGLGELVAAHARFEETGGALKILNLSENVADLMMMTKLHTVFDIYDDEQSAVESFEDNRERITKEIPAFSGGLITRELPENFEADPMVKSSIE